jgi:hypothetical protein
MGLTILYYIFAQMTPMNEDTFIEAQFNDYKNATIYEFLMDLNFGSQLEFKSDYAILGTLQDLCYNGICNLDSSNKMSENCSDACLNSTKYCYDNSQRCNSKICTLVSKRDSYYNSACHEHNRIKFWRNTEFFRVLEKYKITPYFDIVSKDKDCLYGYKKCGIINEKKDYLCLKNDKEFECPINDIIVKSDNESIDGYHSFKLGDKYLFVSHEKTDNYLIKDISIGLDIDIKNSDIIAVDTVSFEELSNYNYIYLDDINVPSLAHLNIFHFKMDLTYERLAKDIEIMNKKKGIYTAEKLKEMNLEVLQYKKLLFGFGIAIVCTLCVYIVLVFRNYCLAPDDSESDIYRCLLCYIGFTPIKYVFHIYLTSFPILFMLIFSFICTIIKKNTYNKLLSMEYIEEFKNLTNSEGERYDYLGRSIIYNIIQFIILLIILILLILYPLIVIVLYCGYKEKKDKENLIKNDENNNCRNNLNAEPCNDNSKPINSQTITST